MVRTGGATISSVWSASIFSDSSGIVSALVSSAKVSNFGSINVGVSATSSG